jgi:thiol-disulfide isomerase/thioredoxin
MAAIASTMTPLGTIAPDFTLPDVVSDREISLQELQGNIATVIMFICNHCPYVKHANPQIVQLANDYKNKNVSFIAISSNDVKSYPEDGPEQMKEVAKKLKYPFPYLYDETQEVAKSYKAVCTPDFFIFNEDMVLVYRGQLDDSRPENGVPLTGKDIRNALEAILKGEPVPGDQKPSVGCSIKWKDEL